jgi:nucleoside-diphosphate-sugar epimerase
MTDPAAKGERFIASNDGMVWMQEVARILRERMGAAARRAPAGELPDWMVKLAANFDPVVRQIVPELNRERPVSSEKARRLLGWKPRSNEEAVVATAESVIAMGLVKGLAAAA